MSGLREIIGEQDARRVLLGLSGLLHSAGIEYAAIEGAGFGDAGSDCTVSRSAETGGNSGWVEEVMSA